MVYKKQIRLIPLKTTHLLLSGIIKISLGISLLSPMVLITSCENDVNEANKISKLDSIPVESVKNIEVVYSEQGRVQLMLTSPLLLNHPGEDEFLEFPKSFKVVMYDSLKRQKNQLTANYGVKYEKRKLMEAKGNVILLNYLKNERLNTEHLVWDQQKKIIYSDKFVTIHTQDKIIYGDGLESDENFDKWHIIKVKGIFYVNE